MYSDLEKNSPTEYYMGDLEHHNPQLSYIYGK
jgi:hypothetical protein